MEKSKEHSDSNLDMYTKFVWGRQVKEMRLQF